MYDITVIHTTRNMVISKYSCTQKWKFCHHTALHASQWGPMFCTKTHCQNIFWSLQCRGKKVTGLEWHEGEWWWYNFNFWVNYRFKSL